mmetsp:Transcript_73976/g.206600  ORF Transcript_73976/g.206600 Transcript_73976/m.206600 type:complete len:519 (+) Transcript_73976:58-1614(+)
MAGADAASKLLVTGLPGDITSDELHTVFGTYGRVTDVALEGRGSAHVTYDSRKPAEDAVQVLHNVYKIRHDAEHPIQVRWAPQGTSRESHRQEDAGWGGGGGGDGRGAGREGETEHKLFIGSLPSDITEEELQTVFGTYGEVTKVVLLKPNAGGNRAALVFYAAKQSGEDAIKVLDQQYKIRHDAAQPISVRWARDGKKDDRNDKRESSNKVFAGNLPVDLTEDELKTVFETYGKLEKAILLPAKDERGRAALVIYEQREAAETAIKLLNDVYKFRTDSEEPISVKWGKDNSKDDRGGGRDWGGSGGGWGGRDSGGGWSSREGGSWDKGSRSSWGGGGGQSWSGGRGGDWGGGGDRGWKDDRGRGGDSHGGWGKDSSSGRGGWDGGRDGGRDRRDGGSSSGWGGGGGGYDRDRGGKGGGKGGGKDASPSGKVYIANLPEDITEEALTFVFKTYGEVRKVHIMNQKVVRGCVAAFVEYDTTNEAETAIATLNDKYEIRPGYGPIAVRHANAGGSRSKPY